MAKSNVGGAQAFLRGKLGANVYSTGRNGDGVRIQIIREKAPEVANPRTIGQMEQRMFLATIGAAYKIGREIFDHSFEGRRYGQQNMNRFMSVNLKAIREDFSIGSGTHFGGKPYDYAGAVSGEYQVSEGSLQQIAPAAAVEPETTANGAGVLLNIPTNATADSVLDYLGIRVGGMATLVLISVMQNQVNLELENTTFTFLRIKALKAGTIALTTANISEYFQFEAPFTPTAAINGGILEVTWSVPGNTANAIKSYAWIHSEKVNGTWQRSTTSMKIDSAIMDMDQALLTYPLGTARVLNGGPVE